MDAEGRTRGGRALVLGGGGSTGNAWLIGVVAGLADAGVDVSDADLVVGTSAGATAAAQLTTAPARELYDATVAPAAAPVPSPAPRPMAGPGPGQPGAAAGAGRRPSSPAGAVVDHLARTGAIIAAARDAADMRRAIGAGALALEAASDGSWSARWREVVAARLPDPRWPERAVRITAVDARTGEPVVFDRDSGVDLVDAVAASCSSGLPYAIDDRRYVDGGYRRNENADLAAGCARVLVLSPFGGRTRHPLEWGMQLAAQVEELRAGGSRVESIFPAADDEHLFGANAMNPALRPAAARAGHDRGRALAAVVAALWR